MQGDTSIANTYIFSAFFSDTKTFEGQSCMARRKLQDYSNIIFAFGAGSEILR